MIPEPAMSGQPLEKAEQDQARMRAPKALLATVIFCRHGATDHHPDRFYEEGDGPSLNAEGEAQAEALGRWFVGHGSQRSSVALERVSADALYVSPSVRTRQTARPVERALGLEAVAVADLAERSVGRWNGRPVDDIKREDPDGWRRWKSDPTGWTPPGGESLLAFGRRIETAVAALVARHPGGVVVLMTHVGPIRAALGAALGCPPEHGKRFVIEPGSVTRVDYTTSWPNLVFMGVQPT
jgi:broad specificity phosphatase PhoE